LPGQLRYQVQPAHQLLAGLRARARRRSPLRGLGSSTLLPQYKGVGILRGASDASPTTRTYLADGQDAEKILTAARAIRARAGTLSGMAAGETVNLDARDVLADVLAVFAGEPGL